MIKMMTDNDFPNFKLWEFKDKHGLGNGIYYSLGKVLQDLRDEHGSITLSNAYRCPECNALVGGASNSAHLLGAAADFRIDSGYQDNLQNRMALVTQLRKTYNVHFAYCQVDNNTIWDGYNYINTKCNMNTYIHVDTNPIYTFNIKDITDSSCKIDLGNCDEFDYAKYSLNGIEAKDLPITGIIDNLESDKMFTIKIILRIKGSNDWIETETLHFHTKEKITVNIPKNEEMVKVNIITPSLPKEPLNEPKNAKKEHKNILEIIIDLIIKIFTYKR